MMWSARYLRTTPLYRHNRNPGHELARTLRACPTCGRVAPHPGPEDDHGGAVALRTAEASPAWQSDGDARWVKNSTGHRMTGDCPDADRRPMHLWWTYHLTAADRTERASAMPRKNVTANRATLAHRIGYALRHPDRVPRYLLRAGRDFWLRLRSPDHVAYYRAVMKSDTAKNPEAAVGSRTHDRWLALGAMQFDYLLSHGLAPEDRMLEIGCGNLRAGWRFIDYLDPGNYYGIDISPDILVAAQQTLVRHRLQRRLPRLTPVRDLTFDFLPDAHFRVVHAHSVFSHAPLPVIEECFAHVGRILEPGGWFDFTFDRTEGAEHHVLREDFYYHTETLVSLAEKYGLRARFMNDWEQLPHGQSKIRITVPSEVEEAEPPGEAQEPEEAEAGGGSGAVAGGAGGPGSDTPVG